MEKNSAGNFATKRQKGRDLQEIERLFAIFPCSVVEDAIFNGLSDHIYLQQISCLGPAERHFRGAMFNLHDKELSKLLSDLFTNWNFAMEIAESTHSDRHGTGVASPKLDGGDLLEISPERMAYRDHLKKAEQSLTGITQHLCQVFPEFDRIESDKVACQNFLSETHPRAARSTSDDSTMDQAASNEDLLNQVLQTIANDSKLDGAKSSLENGGGTNPNTGGPNPNALRSLDELPDLNITNGEWVLCNSQKMKDLGWPLRSLRGKRSRVDETRQAIRNEDTTAGLDDSGMGWRKDERGRIWYLVRSLYENKRKDK